MRIMLPFLLVLVASAARAQKPGDVTVLGANHGPVSGAGYVLDVGGRFVASIPVSSYYGGLSAGTAAPLNDGVLFASPRGFLPLIQELFRYNGAVTTVTTMPSGLLAAGTRVDQNGDLLLLVGGRSASTSGIYRLSGSTLATLASGLAQPIAFAEDVDTGRFVVTDVRGTVFVVARNGTVILSRQNVFASWPYLGLHADHATGGLLVASGDLLNYQLGPGTLTTVFRNPTGAYRTLDVDPIHRGYYLGGTTGIYWLSQGLSLRTLQTFGLFGVTSVVTWGTRMLTGTARPRPGAAYPIVLAMPGEGSRPYQAAASLSTRPGIPTPAGTVHLTVDALFGASLSLPTIFGGFAGTLGPTGTAPLTINMPNAPALRGVRFFVAAVSYDGTGIRRIAEPLGVTIE